MRIAVAGPFDTRVLGVSIPGIGAEQVFSFPYISLLGQAYLAAGHEVTFVGQAHGLTEGEIVSHREEGFRFHIVGRRLSPGKQALDLYRPERIALRQVFVAGDIDVVHAHWTYEFAAAALSSKLPTVVTAHDAPLTVARHYKHPYWWLRARLGVAVVRRASFLTAVSPSLLTELETIRSAARRRSAERRPVDVIPNGLLPGAPMPSGAELRVADPPYFVSVANGFNTRKNTAVAMQAVARLRSRGSHLKLVVVGDEHEVGGPAWHWARERGLEAGVQFLGRVDNSSVLELLRGAGALVHTSRWEACSIAILEAQRLGTPVIGGAHSGGVPYTLDWGLAGVLADITDPDDVADAMERVLRDDRGRSRIVARARSGVQERFNLLDVADRYLALLHTAWQRNG